MVSQKLFKLHLQYVMTPFGGGGSEITVTVLFFFFQRHHMLISRTFYWATTKFGIKVKLGAEWHYYRNGRNKRVHDP